VGRGLGGLKPGKSFARQKHTLNKLCTRTLSGSNREKAGAGQIAAEETVNVIHPEKSGAASLVVDRILKGGNLAHRKGLSRRDAKLVLLLVREINGPEVLSRDELAILMGISKDTVDQNESGKELGARREPLDNDIIMNRRLADLFSRPPFSGTGCAQHPAMPA
jgi:hypothetical protein